MMVVAVDFNATGLNSPHDSTRAVAALRGHAGRWKSPPACLVVSGDAARRGMFTAAAGLGGWSECLSPGNVPELHDAADQDISLAIIDLAAPVGERMHDTVELAEELASRQHTLVVICGAANSVDEELWSRQLGVWFYLPGVTEGDSLTILCIEARSHLARMNAKITCQLGRGSVALRCRKARLGLEGWPKRSPLPRYPRAPQGGAHP